MGRSITRRISSRRFTIPSPAASPKRPAAPRIEIYNEILARWREKGSSYNRIFEEALSKRGVSDTGATAAACVEIFRSFQPRLTLPERARALLEECAAAYALFLISDGSERLQWAKFDSLGLDRWIRRENVAISGTLGRDFQKPDVRMLSHIPLLDQPHAAGQIVFFGDRECDRLFAENAGFLFVPVAAMNPA